MLMVKKVIFEKQSLSEELLGRKIAIYEESVATRELIT